MPSRVAQMYERILNPVKGWFAMSALDKARPLNAVTVAAGTEVPPGRVVHIDANGEFALGGSGTQMPLYLFKGSHETDVRNDGVSSATGTTHWVAIMPAGAMIALVATGGYELQSTEYDATQTYLPNQLLTASGAGVLTNQAAVQYVNWICGVCSWHENSDYQAGAATAPTGQNAHKINVLTFWSYFLPAAVEQ